MLNQKNFSLLFNIARRFSFCPRCTNKRYFLNVTFLYYFELKAFHEILRSMDFEKLLFVFPTKILEFILEHLQYP